MNVGVVVVVAVAVATTTTTTTATTTTPLDHDWRSLMARRLSNKLDNECTSLLGSVWQRVAPGTFGTAPNTVRAEDARGQQASKLHVAPNSVDPASFVKQETNTSKVVQFSLTRHASTSVPGQNMLNHFLSCSSLVEQACRVKTVWFHL